MEVSIMISPVFHQTAEMNGKDRTIWGGAERYLLELCNLLTTYGAKVTLFQQLMPGEKDGRSVLPRGRIEKNWCGYPVICAPIMEKQSRYGAFPNFNATFNELAARSDLRIYFVTSMAFPQVIRPCISISHGIYWDFASGIDGDVASRAEQLARLREMFLAADVCVAVDHNIKNVVRAMFTGVESAIRVIPNFVDTSVFRPAEVKKRPSKPVVLFPRRFTGVRGCNDFVDASQRISDAEFVACGQADSESTESAIGTIPTLRYIWKTPDEMPDVYRSADMAVVPTKGAEGLSLSLLEAMASGLPLVTTMNGGLGDAVIPGYNALTYDPDHTGCVDAIRTLLDEPGLADKLATRSIEVAKVYDISVWRTRWLDLIKRFL